MAVEKSFGHLQLSQLDGSSAPGSTKIPITKGLITFGDVKCDVQLANCKAQTKVAEVKHFDAGHWHLINKDGSDININKADSEVEKVVPNEVCQLLADAQNRVHFVGYNEVYVMSFTTGSFPTEREVAVLAKKEKLADMKRKNTLNKYLRKKNDKFCQQKKQVVQRQKQVEKRLLPKKPQAGTSKDSRAPKEPQAGCSKDSSDDGQGQEGTQAGIKVEETITTEPENFASSGAADVTVKKEGL